MGSKRRRADQIIKREKSFPVPSPEQVRAAMSGTEAWTAETLARWGIAWPPRKGWREHLESLHRNGVRKWPGLGRIPTLPRRARPAAPAQAVPQWDPPRPADLMRDPDRWAKTDADVVTEGSRAQVIHCIRDAQHDIAELVREVRMWRSRADLLQLPFAVERDAVIEAAIVAEDVTMFASQAMTAFAVSMHDRFLHEDSVRAGHAVERAQNDLQDAVRALVRAQRR